MRLYPKNCRLIHVCISASAFIVQGSYPETLLKSWDTFKRKQKPPSDEQIRPGKETRDQLSDVLTGGSLHGFE